MTSARVCVARRSGAGAKRTRGEDSVSTAWVTSDKTRQQAARDESMTPRSSQEGVQVIGRRAGRPGRFNSAFSSGPRSTSKTMFVSSDSALPSARFLPPRIVHPSDLERPPRSPPLSPRLSLSVPPPPPAPLPPRARARRRPRLCPRLRSLARVLRGVPPRRTPRGAPPSRGTPWRRRGTRRSPRRRPGRARRLTVTRRASRESSHRRSSRAACCAPVTTPRGPEAAPRRRARPRRCRRTRRGGAGRA